MPIGAVPTERSFRFAALLLLLGVTLNIGNLALGDMRGLPLGDILGEARGDTFGVLLNFGLAFLMISIGFEEAAPDDLTGDDGIYGGNGADPSSGRSLPFFQRMPHALHSDLGPLGPERHNGVCVAAQCVHRCTSVILNRDVWLFPWMIVMNTIMYGIYRQVVEVGTLRSF